MRAITTVLVVRITEFGGPDVMKIGTVALAPPGVVELLLQTAIGFNYLDVYQNIEARRP